MNQPTFHYFGNKAGVDGASQVKRTIEEITKGSEYYKRQQEKADLVAEKVARMQKELIVYGNSPQRIQQNKQLVEQKLKEVQLKMDRIWAHFDMDMFFVACELLDKKELQDKPCAVGGSQIISTANYVARKFGVRSAMPTFVAMKLCPNLIMLPLNYQKYKSVSHIFMTILKQYDPNLESMGLDEANMDLTDCLQSRNLQTHEEVELFIEQIRQEVNTATSMTVSGGVGPNKMLAKIASEINKPDGLYVIKQTEEAAKEFLVGMSLRKIPGIGMVTEQILAGLNFKTCGDVRNRADELSVVLTGRTFDFIFYSAWGCSRNIHAEEEEQQSISCSRTFKQLNTQEEMELKIQEIAELLSEDLIQQDKVGNHLTLTLKTCKFEVRNKSIQLPQMTNQIQLIAQFGRQIIKQLWPIEPVRLLGLKMQNLQLTQTVEKRSIQQYCGSKNKTKEIKSELLSDEAVSSLSNQLLSKEASNLESFKPKQITCPICGNEVDCKGNNQLMNKHIDKCLGVESISNNNQPKRKDTGSRQQQLPMKQYKK